MRLLVILFLSASTFSWSQDFDCYHSNFELIRPMIGKWNVSTKDRVSPGEYVNGKGESLFSMTIKGCSVLESFKGSKGGEKWEVNLQTMVKEDGSIERTWLDSQHGGFMLLKGEIKNNSLNALWIRDQANPKMQVKHEMKFEEKDQLKFSTFLSTDYGENWALTHEWNYKKANE